MLEGRSDPPRQQPVAALDLLALDAVQRDGGALAGARLLDGLPVHLHAPHAHGQVLRLQLERVAGADAAAPQRAGHHGAEALDGEDAIHGQARGLVGGAQGQARELRVHRREQLGGAGAGHGRELDHGRGGEGRAGEQRGDVAPDLLDPGGLDQIALGEHDDTARHAEQPHDGEVLAGLGHHALVGGDDEQHQVHAAHAGEHVLDEALVPGHVHDAEVHAAGRDERREAEVDGDAALLLFGQPVGVHAGQAAHERGLAVVDVAGGADDGRAGAGGLRGHVPQCIR